MSQRRRCVEYLLIGVAMACLPHKVYGEELLMGLRLNGEPVSEGELVTVDGDKISLPAALVRRLRLRLPDGAGADGAPVMLNNLPGVRTHIDRQALVLDIDADTDRFNTSVIENYMATHPADLAEHPGAFLNYQLLAQDTQNTKLSSGLFSLGAFTDYGVAISDAVINNTQGAIRLRNYFTQDNGPGKANFIAGDSFLPSDAIGEQFPFGGIQVTSHKSTSDPQQIPSETVLGQAALPSTIDVYVNNALQSRQSVPTGPFELQNIPVATGDGNIRVVVRDALGQEQVVERSFYSSPFLLREGSGDYTYQTGLLRRSYGANSFDYAEPFASGTQRYGWTKWLTTEAHGEVSALRQVAGGQGSFLLAPFGTVRAGGAISNRHGTPGMLGIVGAETDTRPFSIGVSSEISSPHFTQLGYETDRTTRQSAQAQIHYDLDKFGSLAASLIHFELAGQPVSNTAALSYSVNVPKIGFFGVSAFDTLGNHATGIIVSFSAALGERGTVSSQLTHDQNGWGEAAQISETPPMTGGFGYRALADDNSASRRLEAGATYLSNSGEITADAGTLNGAPVGRLGATGSLGFLDNKAFAARQTDGNFAMVDTGGVGGIHVTADRQPMGVTDDDGKLVIAHLRPNEINKIEIDPADIPFDVEVPQPQKDIVPRQQTGYIVDFGLRRVRSATASIVEDDGTFIPAGLQARNVKTGATTIIGNNGLIYLTGLSEDDHFQVALENGTCTFAIRLPDSHIAQPDLGTVICHR